MGFLNNSTANIILDAVLTNKGRELLANGVGNFLISKFFENNMTFAKVLKITPKSNILFVSIKFKNS